jgi:hypothetical protein
MRDLSVKAYDPGFAARMISHTRVVIFNSPRAVAVAA